MGAMHRAFPILGLARRHGFCVMCARGGHLERSVASADGAAAWEGNTMYAPRSVDGAAIQSIPVKLYRSDDRLTVATPMPGLEPEDISVEVTAEGLLILHGQLRGQQKGVNEIILDEWVPGNYHRELALPQMVDGAAANVTYGNGVVVVVLPLSDVTTPAQLQMTSLAHDHGMRIGNAGHFGQFTGSAADVRTMDDLDADDILAEEDDIMIEDIDASHPAEDDADDADLTLG
jgi:HSP20 family protein